MNNKRLRFSNFRFSFLPSAYRLLIVNVGISAGTLLSGLILARVLGPENRGYLGILTIWPLFVSHLSLLGIHLHLGRMAGQSPQSIKSIYRTGYFIIALTTLIAMIIWQLAVTTSSDWPLPDSENFKTLILLSMLIIPFSAWNALQVQIELGRDSLFTYNFARGSFVILQFILIALVAIGGKSELIYYLFCFCVAAIGASLLALIMIQSSFKTELINTSDLEPLKVADTIKRSFPFAISTTTVAIMTMADRLLISIFFEAKILGLYLVAITLTHLQGVITESIAPLFYSRTSKQKDLSSVDSKWLSFRIRQSLLINLFVTGGLILIAPLLLTLFFGNAYQEAVIFAYILIPAMGARSSMRTFEEVLKGGNKPLGQASSIVVISVVFAIGGAIATIFNSPLGVACAMLVANGCGLIFIATRLSKLMDIKLVNLLCPRPSDLSALILEISKIKNLIIR